VAKMGQHHPERFTHGRFVIHHQDFEIGLVSLIYTGAKE